MASKNPIKGYVKCQTKGCTEICTVHAVGEHKAQTTGEVPKNKRRLGQLYTICPVCKTNQSSGEKVQKWLADAMRPTAAELIEKVTETITEEVTAKALPERIEKNAVDVVQPLPAVALVQDEPLEKAKRPESIPATEVTDKNETLYNLIGLLAISSAIFIFLAFKRKPMEQVA